MLQLAGFGLEKAEKQFECQSSPAWRELKPPALLSSDGRAGRRTGRTCTSSGDPGPGQLTATETPLRNPRVRQGLGGSEQQNFSPGTFALSRKMRNGVLLFRFMCPFEPDEIWQK